MFNEVQTSFVREAKNWRFDSNETWTLFLTLLLWKVPKKNNVGIIMEYFLIRK